MMRNYNVCTNKYRMHSWRQQRGVVLLLTLIVLVAMMLAAIGMMRSIDTATMIAGNVAFRQTTLQAGDGGLSTATGKLMGKAATASKIELNNDYSSAAPALAFQGYMAHPFFDCEVDGSCVNLAASNWWDESVTFPVNNWSNAPSFVVTDGAGQPIATVFYLVHRMCTAAYVGYSPNDTPPASPALCQTYEEPSSREGSSMGSGGTPFKNRSVFFRITAKSVGPRNTVTYSQALVLVPE